MRSRDPIISVRRMMAKRQVQSILFMIILAGAAKKVVQTPDAKIVIFTLAPSRRQR